MKEAGFTSSLRKKITPALYALKLSLPYEKGVPDCYYSGSKSDLWNEHKYVQTLPPVLDLLHETPKGERTLLSRHQEEWLRARHREGRDVAVIVGSPEGAIYLPEVSWELPITREEFRAKAKSTAELARFLIDLLGERA